MPNRLITDNVCMIFKTIHNLKNRRSGDLGYCALKIDISKAYDRVDWNYLNAMLLALGFLLSGFNGCLWAIRILLI